MARTSGFTTTLLRITGCLVPGDRVICRNLDCARPKAAICIRNRSNARYAQGYQGDLIRNSTQLLTGPYLSRVDEIWTVANVFTSRER